jgi:hypothetical protein
MSPFIEPFSTVAFGTPILVSCCTVKYLPTLSHPRGLAVRNVTEDGISVVVALLSASLPSLRPFEIQE